MLPPEAITDLHCLNLPTLGGTESLQERASKALFPTNNSNENHCILSGRLFRVLQEFGISAPQKLTKSSRQWSRAVIAIPVKTQHCAFYAAKKTGCEGATWPQPPARKTQKRI